MTFFEKIQLDLQPPDLLVERGGERLNAGFRAPLTGFKQLRQVIEQLAFPLADLGRMNLVLLSQFTAPRSARSNRQDSRHTASWSRRSNSVASTVGAVGATTASRRVNSRGMKASRIRLEAPCSASPTASVSQSPMSA